MKTILTFLIVCYALLSFGQNCIPNTSSITFDGTSTYVNTTSSNSLELTDSITIEAWINASAWGATSAKGSIVCKHGWFSGEEGYVLRAGGNGQLSFNIAGDSSGVPVSWREVTSNSGIMNLNTWYHVAGTFDGANLKVYVNGVLQGTTPFPGSIITTSAYTIKIGRLSDMNEFESRFWTGKIDEVRIWHRALSSSELIANMNRHIDPLAAVNLVGYWRFNESSGTAVTDLGSGNNPATLISGTWSTDVPFTGGPATPLITQSGATLYSNSPTGNQWNLNGLPIGGAVNSSYTPLQNGNFSVTVTDNSGCSATSQNYPVTTVGIEKLNAENVFSSMKFDGRFLRFNLSQEMLNRILLNVYDSKGDQIVFKNSGTLKNETDLGSLPSGVYILNILFNNNVYKKRIVCTPQ